MKIFTVFDSKAAAYLNPFYERSAGLAIRAFEDAANTPDHQFNKYPGDFTLFEIGTFDQDTGTIATLNTHTNLGLAIHHIKEQLPAPTPIGVIAGGE